MLRPVLAIALIITCIASLGSAATAPRPAVVATRPATAPSTQKSPEVGERVPSEDPIIKDLHSLGLINGRTNIFRSASPVRDLVKGQEIPADTSALKAQARARMQHLFDLGIRTIISFEDPDTTRPDPESAADSAQRALWISLEKNAAKEVGLNFISWPINNTGEGSLQTLSDAQVLKIVEDASQQILKTAQAGQGTGGVLFHCAAGHDRTGIVAAYIRIKIQQWPVDQAIDEMRRLGHNWVKYSNNDGKSSWHEDHLRAIAELIKKP